MGMGLIGYALTGAGEGLGAGIAATGFEAMKQTMEQNRQAALLQMREEMDIAKEQRHEETAKRLRETEGTPENIALQGSQVSLRKAKDAEAESQFQRTGNAKFADGGELFTNPQGEVYRLDKDGNAVAGFQDKDAYARGQLGLVATAGLAKTEADTKLHEAQAEKEAAYGRLLDRSAGRGMGGGKSDAGSYRMMESDKIEYQENAKDIREIRKDATMEPTEKDRRIAELQRKNERIMFRIARNGDMRPSEDDISELRDNYSKGNGSVVARFNHVFGEGEAERILSTLRYPGMIEASDRQANQNDLPKGEATGGEQLEINTRGVPILMRGQFARIAKEVQRGTASSKEITWYNNMLRQQNQWLKDAEEGGY